MANPQPENGTTRISHEVLEKLLEYPFTSPCQLKLCLFVIRKTWGFAKKTDKISITQFQKAVKASRPTVVHWLNQLVNSLLLVKGGQPFACNYGFNKDWEAWVVNPLKLVKARHYTSKPPLTKTSKPPLTHNRKIETIQKKVNDQPKEIFIEPAIIAEMKTKFVPENQISVEAEKFLNWWNEMNLANTKRKWGMQKTFEVKRRFLTWLDRSEQVQRIGDQFYVSEFRRLGIDQFALKYGVDKAKKYNKQINA